MAGWSGPQWVLATLFVVATLMNIGGTAINKKPVADNVGFVVVRGLERGVLIAILVWGGFF